MPFLHIKNQTFAAPRSRMPLKREKKVMVVMVAARMSLTGSARNTSFFLGFCFGLFHLLVILLSFEEERCAFEEVTVEHEDHTI